MGSAGDEGGPRDQEQRGTVTTLRPRRGREPDEDRMQAAPGEARGETLFAPTFHSLRVPVIL